jgi:alkylated DNA repair dioxygenase AlkB
MLQEALTIINKEGIATYFGPIISIEENENTFNQLLENIDWNNEVGMMFGKEFITKRKVAFYADNAIEYTYSNKTKKGAAWTPQLMYLKKLVESYTNAKYNACLLNLYHNGEEGMGWHSDDEKEIVQHSSIASLSIGVARKFSFKHKANKEKIDCILESGSLLEMKGAMQTNWWHALPKTKKVLQPRINLTFRQMIKQ